MTLEEHSAALGKLLSNLQTVELLARMYIHEKSYKAENKSIPPFKINSPVGSTHRADPFNNYDTLTTTLKKYNNLNNKATVDIDSLVELRDALAHGRILGEIDDDNLRLLKFSKEQNGEVRVTYNETLSKQWFDSNIKKTSEAANTIHRSLNELQEHQPTIT
ncbi:hypothetical protein [Pseudomonas sp. ICMP 10191]|jgi:hypothetical protein|uniref:hypothetical protein n=1 Tax=Pseudomonas sp. ICMP 10191 TaxID=1198294 RepID=UPI000731026C|nr:hypothetical protein [Pseudomonas sp. ICMP 10191]KTB97120.1 hypothetical protein AO388_25625 [Pseudomonas sp. ICMP 10191]